jgi:hypothetical protein
MQTFFKDHPNFETKTKKVPKNEEERMKMNFQIFHVLKLKWKHHGKNGFLCVNNYKKVDCKIPQMMCCIIFYTILLMHIIPKLRQEKV